MNLIDKDVLVSEIENQQRKLFLEGRSNEVELRKNAAIQNGVYVSLLSFINTLKVKEVDLNDEKCEYLNNDDNCIYALNKTGKVMRCEYINCSRKIKAQKGE